MRKFIFLPLLLCTFALQAEEQILINVSVQGVSRLEGSQCCDRSGSSRRVNSPSAIDEEQTFGDGAALRDKEAGKPPERILINNTPLTILPEQKIEVERLASVLSQESPSDSNNHNPHIIKEVNYGDRCVSLHDDSVWKIGWWYRNDISEWLPDHQLRISHSKSYINNIKMENLDLGNSVWATIENYPTLSKSENISAYSTFTFDPEDRSTLITSEGAIFKGPVVSWNVRDALFVFDNDAITYDLWNLTTNEIARDWTLVGNEKKDSSQSVLNLPKQLNKRVLGQSTAIDTVCEAIVNYWTGFKDSSKPVGVFLFLGPTGVGKTELARCLTDELFNSQHYLTRFDMSHFNEPHSAASLIGAPPGYLNHEEGGLLTNAIKDKPKSIILLDAFEKANSTVQKLFLPVFEDGFIADTKNRTYSCADQMFIVYSNICSLEIAQLFEQGLSSQEILASIEPEVISNLSPEIYGRVTPIVFNNLTPQLMVDLVDLALVQVCTRLELVRDVQLIVEESAKEYLVTNGFHPTLGARPLRRLIHKKIVTPVSFAMITECIPGDSTITIAYNKTDDSWNVTWQPN